MDSINQYFIQCRLSGAEMSVSFLTKLFHAGLSLAFSTRSSKSVCSGRSSSSEPSLLLSFSYISLIVMWTYLAWDGIRGPVAVFQINFASTVGTKIVPLDSQIITES